MQLFVPCLLTVAIWCKSLQVLACFSTNMKVKWKLWFYFLFFSKKSFFSSDCIRNSIVSWFIQFCEFYSLIGCLNIINVTILAVLQIGNLELSSLSETFLIKSLCTVSCILFMASSFWPSVSFLMRIYSFSASDWMSIVCCVYLWRNKVINWICHCYIYSKPFFFFIQKNSANVFKFSVFIWFYVHFLPMLTFLLV